MELSGPGLKDMVKHLDQERVLQALVGQLNKDLSTGTITAPAISNAFEDLRAQVLPILEGMRGHGDHVLRAALYRVDVPEAAVQDALRTGMDELATRVVLRCLQKVITRLHLRPH